MDLHRAAFNTLNQRLHLLHFVVRRDGCLLARELLLISVIKVWHFNRNLNLVQVHFLGPIDCYLWAGNGRPRLFYWLMDNLFDDFQLILFLLDSVLTILSISHIFINRLLFNLILVCLHVAIKSARLLLLFLCFRKMFLSAFGLCCGFIKQFIFESALRHSVILRRRDSGNAAASALTDELDSSARTFALCLV